MGTRWFRQQYDSEYERHAHPERDDASPKWELAEKEINPTTGYDPERDRDMRFRDADWGELVGGPRDRPNPTTILPADLAVSGAICDRLEREPSVDLAKIGVYAEAGVITLTGVIGTAMKRKVLEIVQRVPGVVRVVDRLT